MRIVLDTNSLIQIIPSRSPYHNVWTKIVEGLYQMCVSTDILEEYTEILQRLTDIETAQLTVDVIINNPGTILVNPQYNLHIIESDPDDNKFVDCAFASTAKYIVTNDHHYSILKQIEFPHIDIISLKAFSDLL